MSIFLVTGGSGFYGTKIVSTLRNAGHGVYDIQRHARPATEDLFLPHVEVEYWISADFDNPPDVIRVATELHRKKVKLDGIVHAVKKAEDVPPELLTPIELETHFSVNVFCPLLLTMYLYQSNILKKNSKVLFTLDSCKGEKNKIAYEAANQATLSIAESLKIVMEELEFLYLRLPDQSSSLSDDVENQVANILTSEKPMSTRLVDLRNV